MSSKVASKVFTEIKNAMKTLGTDTGLLTFNEVEQDQFDMIRQGLHQPTNYLEKYAFHSPVTKAHYMNYEFTSNSTITSDFDYIFEAPHCPIYIQTFGEVFNSELFEIEEEYTQEPSWFTVPFGIPTRDQFNCIYRTWYGPDFEWSSTESINLVDWSTQYSDNKKAGTETWGPVIPLAWA
ncbi:hypothetical protein HOY80DRAFT_1043065 [Tuber brumale]|nr:hypothetical protein HOY80DRAFT_1043065 [Tuber brumale]